MGEYSQEFVFNMRFNALRFFQGILFCLEVCPRVRVLVDPISDDRGAMPNELQ